jgi:hypothetical protein
MDNSMRTYLDNLRSSDKQLQNEAFYAVVEATDQPVDWAYEIWDSLVEDLSHKDNHRRAIASQVLANLARSDPDNRMARDFDALLNVTRDERFVTARHCLQAIWKVGMAGAAQQQQVTDGLERRFHECRDEKNWSLIRYDIIQGLRNLYDHAQDEAIRAKALELIEAETDAKYKKKYASIWRSA